MIKTTHPMNCDFIKLANTAIEDSAVRKVEQVYNDYNKGLPKLIEKLPDNVVYSFFEGDEQLMAHDITVKGADFNKEDETLEFNIQSFFHAQDKNAVGSLLFTGVKNLIAEFDDSPVTVDYLLELLEDRDLLEIYFDVLENGKYSIDIYSLSEETYEDEKDDDDFQVLHIQFQFSGFGTNLEAITPEQDDNDNIDAMDTF